MNRLHLGMIALTIVALLAPATNAGTTISGSMIPANVVSAPAYYWANTFTLNLEPGDTVSAALTYASTFPSDLDLTLTSNFYAPVPIPPTECQAADVPGCQAASSHYVDQRVGRVTCTDTIGASEHHPDDGAEGFTATTSIAGAHQLAIIDYFSTPNDAPAYSLAITVTRGGDDVTASTVNVVPVAGYTINNYVHCAALGLRN